MHILRFFRKLIVKRSVKRIILSSRIGKLFLLFKINIDEMEILWYTIHIIKGSDGKKL